MQHRHREGALTNGLVAGTPIDAENAEGFIG
jgi:hypothetical protein